MYPCGFFDGAAAGGGGGCGAGVVLHLNTSVSFRIHLNMGPGTNTRSELCALWLLLYFARRLQVSSIVVMGDSSSIISWALGSSTLNVLILTEWIAAVRRFIGEFQHIHFAHVFREMNMEADILSKRALNSPAGIILWEGGMA